MQRKIEPRRLCGGMALVAMVLVGAGASAQEVRYDVMPGTDFAKYKTYKWVPIEGAENPGQIVAAQITQAFDQELAKKGFSKTDGETADMFIGYQVSLSQERQWNAYGGGMGWRFGGGMASATSSTLKVGTLGFDVYDPATKKLIWRGDATKTLDASSNPEKQQKNLDKAVDKLLKNFPPKK